MHKRTWSMPPRAIRFLSRGVRGTPYILVVLVLVGTLSSGRLRGQDSAVPAPIPGPAEILRGARTIFIVGSRDFPPEPLEKKLFENKDFKNSGLVVVQDREKADLLILLEHKGEVKRDFTYRMVHPATDVVLGSGKVIAWDGIRAAPGLAKQISQRIKELRQPPKR